AGFPTAERRQRTGVHAQDGDSQGRHLPPYLFGFARGDQAAFFSAFRHFVQRSSLLVNFLWKVWPQLMQISRPLSFLPMTLIVASRGSTWQKYGPAGPGTLDSPAVRRPRRVA